MIYNYHCVACGSLLEGWEVKFDLARIIGLYCNGIDHRLFLIDATQLQELADKNHLKLVHGQSEKIVVTLHDFLTATVTNIESLTGRSINFGKRENVTMQSLPAFSEELLMTWNADIEKSVCEEFYIELISAFSLSNDVTKHIQLLETEFKNADKDFITKIRNNLSNHVATAYIMPEYFEGGKSSDIYSIHFSRNAEKTPMEAFLSSEEIRGYCPVCGKPVLKGTGMYQHIMIGFIGFHATGKTMLIISMIRELQKSYNVLGISHPGQPLSDGNEVERKRQFDMFDRGWAACSSEADPRIGSTSMNLQSADRKINKILTLVNLPGESFFEVGNHAPSILLTACDIYFYCSPIRTWDDEIMTRLGYNQRVEGNRDIEVVTSLYREIVLDRKKHRRIPPLCIVLTKTDLVGEPHMNIAEDNPVRRIKTSKFYEFSSELDDLSLTYDTCEDSYVKTSIKTACVLLNAMQNVTYLCMLSCSATGRETMSYMGTLDSSESYTENAHPQPFNGSGLDSLWRWILRIVGLTMDSRGHGFLKTIPSYSEIYMNSDTAVTDDTFSSLDYEIRKRLIAINQLFINGSPLDRSLAYALTGPVKRKFFQKEEDARQELINNIIESNRINSR